LLKNDRTTSPYRSFQQGAGMIVSPKITPKKGVVNNSVVRHEVAFMNVSSYQEGKGKDTCPSHLFIATL